MLIPMKKSMGKVCINKESAGNCQLPCGKKMLWNNVNKVLKLIKLNKINTDKLITVVHPAYLNNFDKVICSLL